MSTAPTNVRSCLMLMWVLLRLHDLEERMGQAVPIRTDYTAGEVRRFAKCAKDGRKREGF